LGAKVLRTEESVQLIVFLAAIREILKREIYEGNKQNFCAVKTKGQSSSFHHPSQPNANRADSLCE